VSVYTCLHVYMHIYIYIQTSQEIRVNGLQHAIPLKSARQKRRHKYSIIIFWQAYTFLGKCKCWKQRFHIMFNFSRFVCMWKLGAWQILYRRTFSARCQSKSIEWSWYFQISIPCCYITINFNVFSAKNMLRYLRAKFVSLSHCG
jgi:hypothetical protein